MCYSLTHDVLRNSFMDTRKKLGDFGETAALGFLVRQGLCEVERQWRCAQGEIDLVMRDGTTLVFVEVRTRRSEGALESVGPRKQARLAALAYTYLAAHELPEATLWRIDVLALTIAARGQIGSIEWVQSAVEER